MQKIHALKKNQYRKLFATLRKRKTADDDLLFEKTHDSVFANINCLDCANCCKTHSPLFIEKDIIRIAKHLHIKPVDFMRKYLLLDEDGDWVFQYTPCPFLQTDNTCSIYSARPKACREYPHTNRKKMYQIENITILNADICPAVSQILDIVSQKIEEK